MDMTITAREAAKTICNYGNWKVTNLELQKILYLIHMVYMGNKGTPLIDGKFEAWPLGPVNKEIYDAVKVFGAAPIADIFINEDIIADESEESRFLKDGCEHLLKKSSGELVSITHKDKGAWKKTRKEGKRIIDNRDIEDEYEKLYK